MKTRKIKSPEEKQAKKAILETDTRRKLSITPEDKECPKARDSRGEIFLMSISRKEKRKDSSPVPV